MTEATNQLYSPRQLRFLFCELILDGSPAVALFEKFHDNLIADYIDRGVEESEDLLLSTIATFIEERGKTMSDFGLPDPVRRISEAAIFREHFGSRVGDLLAASQNLRNQMNLEQGRIYDLVKTKIDNKEPLFGFIDGQAGRGKTFLVDAIIKYVRGKEGIALPCATTALAASNYEGGTTAHSLFRVPVEESNEQLLSTILENSERWKLLKEADIIVWDEFAMVNKAVFECADQLMKCIMKSREPFGGKVFIALGDFRQTATVVGGGGKTATVMASVRTLPIWEKFNIYKLTQRIRDAEDAEYSSFADSIGDGVAGNIVEIGLLPVTTSEEEAINFVYPEEVLSNPGECVKRSILCTLNKNVDHIN